MLSWSCGDYDKSRAFHERDLELRRALNDTRGIARALGNLGILASEQGEFTQAGALYAESLALYRGLSDDLSIAHMLNNLANLHTAKGDYTAGPMLRESLALYRQVGNGTGIAAALHNLGDLHTKQGRLDDAELFFRESLRAQQALGDKQRIASTLTHLAGIAGAQQDHERACLLFAAADGILQASSVPRLPLDSREQSALDTTRRALDSKRFGALWSRGHAMNSEQAISLVLENHAPQTE